MKKPVKPEEPLRYYDDFMPSWARPYARGVEHIVVSVGGSGETLLEEEDFTEDGEFVDPRLERFLREGLGLDDKTIQGEIDLALNGDYDEGGMYSVSIGTMRKFAEIYGVGEDTVSVGSSCGAMSMSFNLTGYIQHTPEEVQAAQEAARPLEEAFQAKREQWRRDMEQYEEDLAAYQLWKIREKRAGKR